MAFIIRPSLKHIAFMKIAAVLFENDIHQLVAKYSPTPVVMCFDDEKRVSFKTSHECTNWEIISNRVKENVSKLKIPNKLKDNLINCINAVGLQISEWLKYLMRCFSLDIYPTNEFFWTSQGILDKKKTTEMLIKNENIDTITRYRLACNYCLEDDIPELWNKLDESERKYFWNDENFQYKLHMELQIFWTHYVKGEMDMMNCRIRRRLNHTIFSPYQLNPTIFCPYQYMLQCAAGIGNKEAVTYFLKKISPSMSLIDIALYVCHRYFLCETMKAPHIHYTEVLCYLLSQMNHLEQKKVFKTFPFEVLFSLLHWPYQLFFAEIAGRVINFISGSNCLMLLLHIIEKKTHGPKDYNYQKMFEQFWHEVSRSNHTNHIANGLWYLLPLLFSKKEIENIKLILRDESVHRMKLIFCERSFLEEIVKGDNNCDLLKFFFQQCTSSKDEMLLFKQKFQEYFQRRNVLSGNKLEECIRHLDAVISEHDKRRKEDEDERNKAKKLNNV